VRRRIVYRPSSMATSTSRAAPVLALLLVMLGSCGTLNSAAGLQGDLVPPAATNVSGATEAEALEQVQRKLVEVLLFTEWRRPLSGANLIVSVLLVIAGVALLRRRPTAIWWTTQAGIANGMLAVGECAAQLVSLRERWNEIVSVAPEHRELGAGIANDAIGVVVVVAVVRILLYVFVVWRVRRPDVRAMANRSSAPE
jgi:hypothetical protein